MRSGTGATTAYRPDGIDTAPSMKGRLAHILGHEGFQRYFSNTSWLMAERVLRMVVALFVGVYVARYLGPENFGLLSYALSFAGLFLTIATLGLDGILVRDIVREPASSNVLLGTAFRLKIIGTLLMWAGIALALPLTQYDAQANTLIAVIAFSYLFQIFNVVDFKFQAEVKSKFVVHAQLIQLFVSSVVKLLLIFGQADLIWFAMVYVLDGLVLAASLLVMYRKNIGRIIEWNWDTGLARRLLKDSWPMILAGLVISVYMRIDQVMIKQMMTASDVGLYSAAVRLSEAWYFIPTVIVTSLFPAIINARSTDRKLYESRIQKLFDLLTWIAIAVAVPLTFLSEWIVSLLYGQVYIEAATVLSLHIWAGVFVFLGVASSRWHMNENLQQLYFVRTLSGVVINVLLNVILIPRYGINGAAIATIISQIVASYLFDLAHSKTRPIFYMKTKSFFIIRRLLPG